MGTENIPGRGFAQHIKWIVTRGFGSAVTLFGAASKALIAIAGFGTLTVPKTSAMTTTYPGTSAMTATYPVRAPFQRGAVPGTSAITATYPATGADLDG